MVFHAGRVLVSIPQDGTANGDECYSGADFVSYALSYGIEILALSRIGKTGRADIGDKLCLINQLGFQVANLSIPGGVNHVQAQKTNGEQDQCDKRDSYFPINAT